MFRDKEYHDIFKLACLLVLLATGTGIGAILLHYLLEIVEEVVVAHEEMTLEVLKQVSIVPRRVVFLILIGVAVSIGWYLLQRKAPLISIKKQFQGEDDISRHPSLWRQTWHIILQIVSVGAGSPVGKEVAPRELGSLLAGRLADCFHLTASDRRLVIACGAGAGLAAIYQVPFASIFFVFESFSLKVNGRNLLTVATTIFTASYVARIVISDSPLYQTQTVPLTLEFGILAIVFPILLLPILFFYHFLVKLTGKYRMKDKKILVYLPLVLTLVAITSIVYPEILGNGSLLAQSIFNGESHQRIFILAILKFVFVVLTLIAGAYGGTLTPSFALGIAIASLIAIPFQLVFPMLTLEMFLLIGATTFLAVMLNAPFTAATLVLAFTGQKIIILFPLVLTSFVAHKSFTYLSTKRKIF